MKALLSFITIFAISLLFIQCANKPKEPVKDADPVVTYNGVEMPASESPEKDTIPSLEARPKLEEPAKKPEFTGGSTALENYLKKNLVYPSKDKEDGVMGRVVVKFIVTAAGEITFPEILRSLSPDTDTEALRLVKEMPKWTPAKNKDGKPIDAEYVLNVRFTD